MSGSSILPDDMVPRAALISPDAAFRSLISRCVGELVPSVEWVLQAENDIGDLRSESVDRLSEREPDLLFVDVGKSPDLGARFVEAVTARSPDLVVVAAGDPLDVDDLLNVIQAGASGYLRRPLNHDEVAEACANVLRKLRPRKTSSPDTAKVIALFSPKGGTGVSTLATNLAVYVRQATDKRTLLLDLSPELGTSSVMLGIEPRYSYLDVIESLHRMDEGLLNSFLEAHGTGVRVLSSPPTALMARELTAESVAYLLRLVRRHFDYIVIDVGRGVLDHAAAKALELADEQLLVATGELPMLRNATRVVPHLSQDGVPRENPVRLVVNRYDEGRHVSGDDIERAVGLSIHQTLVEDRERVSKSVNLGQPIVLNGSSPFSKGIRKLGDGLATDDLLPKAGRRSFGRMMKAMLPPFGRTNGQAPAAQRTTKGKETPK